MRGVLRTVSYIVGAIAMMMVFMKLTFHFFSNDDIIAVVFIAALLRIISGLTPKSKEARDAKRNAGAGPG